jgi:hypothetical protein
VAKTGVAKSKTSKRTAPVLTIREKQFPPGVRHDVTVKTVTDYLKIVDVQQDSQIIRWSLVVMSVFTGAFLLTWFLWGSGFLPNLNKDLVKWFGEGTLGVDGSAFATIIGSRFRKKK